MRKSLGVLRDKCLTLLRLAGGCLSISSNLFSTSFFLSSYFISFRRSLRSQGSVTDIKPKEKEIYLTKLSSFSSVMLL